MSSNKITDAIVFGENDKFLTKEFQNECTKEELKELRDVLFGWTTMSCYNNQYKKKLWDNIKYIDELLAKK